jgi:hypothetical protein
MKYVFTKRRRAALRKAQRKWKGMSKRARAKAMPRGRGKISKR